MELKLDKQNLRGSKRAHTLDFYTCSGRFPVMATIKEICSYMHDDSYEHGTKPERSPGWVRPMSSQPFFGHVADMQEFLEILDPSRAKYTLH